MSILDERHIVMEESVMKDCCGCYCTPLVASLTVHFCHSDGYGVGKLHVGLVVILFWRYWEFQTATTSAAYRKELHVSTNL